jgi:hypothetical protein
MALTVTVEVPLTDRELLESWLRAHLGHQLGKDSRREPD